MQEPPAVGGGEARHGVAGGGGLARRGLGVVGVGDLALHLLQLRAGRGSLVHVASIAASNAQGKSGAYSVSKAGVVMLSRQLAGEWGPDGIRSNVVSPGMVITPMSQAFYDTPGVTERRSAVTPMRRIAMPQDIADAVMFLASDRASYVTADEIIVDGGFTRTIMNLVPRPGHD